MKKIFYLLLLFVSSVNVFAQPANDNPCSATNMGSLPNPGACIAGLQNGAVTTLSNQSTVGATGASPYVFQAGCSGGGSQAAPALDVWYRFTATGNLVNIAIAGFPNASVALWTGTCTNLQAWGCMNVPAGGNGTFTAYQLVIGQTYWIEVSGNNSTATDNNFSISVDNDIDCNNCLQTASITASPLPVNGGYTAGQVVNFCYTVTGWTQVNTNWIHGVQITMGAGWTGAFSNTVPANTVQTPASSGSWLFYPGGIGTVNGQSWGPGFYFDTNDAGTNPNNNFGDNCNGAACTWTFCWSLTVGACTPGMNLNVIVNTSGDGESGSWSNPGCNGDAPTLFSAVGVCCTPPVMTSPNTATICSGSTVSIPFTSTPSATSYTWVAANQPNVTGESTTTQNTNTLSNTLVNTTNTSQVVAYTVTPSTTCAGTPQTVNVTVNPTPVVTQVANITTCNNSNISAMNFISNVAGTTFSWANSNPSIGLAANGTGGLPTFTATNSTGAPVTSTITVTPTANGCAGTPMIFTITVNPTVTPTFTQVPAICSGGNFTLPITSNNGINGTWSPAINNTATTLYTFTPTAGQCATITTMTVTVNAPTTPTFTQVAPICSGGSFSLPTTSNNGINGTWSPAINNTATTLYTFTPTAGQCASTTTMTVSVNAPTTPTFTQVAAICSGGSFTLPTISNNGFNGTWSPAINNTATTLYTFTPNAGQCATTTTMTVTVNSPVTPTFTPVAAICSGGSLNLPSISNNGFNGTWSPAINNTATTLYTFTPNAGQCATTSTMTVTVNPNPTVNVPANISACPGDLIPTTNFTSNPNGATFTWTNTNSNIGLGANGVGDIISFNATNGIGNTIQGIINVTPTLNGCVGISSSYTITVNDYFDPTITPAGPFCTAVGIQNLQAASSGGVWSGTGIVDATLGTFDPSVSGAGTFPITYTISGSCGSSDAINITVIQNVNATVTPAGPFCTNDPAVVLTAVDPGGIWSGTGITNTSIGIFDPSIAGAGNHNITYTIGGMCGDTESTIILVTSLANSSITPVASVCQLASAFNLNAATPGGTWSGNGITNTTNGTFNPTVAGVGVHNITYTIGGNCGTSSSINVTVLPNADATINPAGPFCLNGNTINLTSINSGGTWSGNGITNAANGTFNPSVAGVGTHIITYTIAGACGDSKNISVTVVANMNATITPAGPFCTNATAINLTAVDPGGTWSGTGITNATNGTFNPSVAGSGTHTITYTIGGSCGSTDTETIVVNAIPVVSFAVDQTNGCVPLTVNFSNNSTPAGSTFNWTMSDGFTSSATGNISHTFTTPGCFNISLQVTSPQGCVSSQTQNNLVCVAGIPNAEFSWSPMDATITNPIINFMNQSTGATLYQWDFASLGNSATTHPSFTFPNNTSATYQVCLVAENNAGCLDSICHLIQIKDEFLFYAPNAFTPDGNGINEIFIPIMVGHDPLTYELTIFNRWGELIFLSQQPTIGWDGTHKGTMSQQDVYVWKVKVREENLGEQHEYIGHVNLLK